MARGITVVDLGGLLVDPGDRHVEPGLTRISAAAGTAMRRIRAQDLPRLPLQHALLAVQGLIDRFHGHGPAVRHPKLVSDLLRAPPAVEQPVSHGAQLLLSFEQARPGRARRPTA